MSVILPKPQIQVLLHMFEHAPISESANTLDFHLKGDFGGTFYAAFSTLNADTQLDANLVFTLATFADCVFMAVSATRELEVVRALVNMENYERKGTSHELSETIQIPDAFFGTHGLCVAMLFPPSTLFGFDLFEDCYDVGDRHLRFFLVMFLTTEEYEYKKLHGHNALMDRFIKDERSFIVFPK